jgi:hypothetical protein
VRWVGSQVKDSGVLLPAHRQTRAVSARKVFKALGVVVGLIKTLGAR